MTLIDRIRREVCCDDEGEVEDNDKLVKMYRSADAAGKKLLDDAFVCISGWTLKSLIGTGETWVGAKRRQLLHDSYLGAVTLPAPAPRRGSR